MFENLFRKKKKEEVKVELSEETILSNEYIRGFEIGLTARLEPMSAIDERKLEIFRQGIQDGMNFKRKQGELQ